MALENADCHQRSLTQKQFQRCDTKVIDLVYGYVKNADVYIPNEVALLCLAYYYVDEHFTIAPPNYDIVKLRNEIRLVRNGTFGSAFGNVLIHSDLGGIYVWQFNIVHIVKYGNVTIGISTEYTKPNKVFDGNRCGNNYSLSEGGYLYNNGGMVSKTGYGGFNAGDILTMTLDLNKKTLKYERKGCCDAYEDEGFDDIACGPDIRYKMAISLVVVDEQIELITFWTR